MPKIENEAQLWTNLQLMCKVFFISENLFQKVPISETVKNMKNKIANNSRSDSIDSNSLNSLKQSTIENLANNEETTSFVENSNKRNCFLKLKLTFVERRGGFEKIYQKLH